MSKRTKYKKQLKQANMAKDRIIEKIDSIESDKLTLDNIYKVLICFDKLYDKMDQTEKRQLVSALVDKVEIYECLILTTSL